jgi:caffeoyl-CoA O-methyltransferase
MFHTIPTPVQERMRALEAIDFQDRADGTPVEGRLRQIPPETGRFLALLAAAAPPGALLEVGASAGYSALWLSLACRERGDRLTTFDILENKVRLAAETFRLAQVEALVQIIHGDARDYLGRFPRVAFCFMDAEKHLYRACYDLVVPNLVPGGWFVADNAISHAAALADFIAHARADPRLDALIVPIGKGLLLCRKI